MRYHLLSRYPSIANIPEQTPVHMQIQVIVNGRCVVESETMHSGGIHGSDCVVPKSSKLCETLRSDDILSGLTDVTVGMRMPWKSGSEKAEELLPS